MIESFTNNSGILYPPKNNIAVIQLNNTIEEYSPRKKNTKGTEECSVKNPATNSDSYLSTLFFKESKIFNIIISSFIELLKLAASKFLD
jgi:hypothetical protein